jgi:hypothetical protein
MGARLFQSLYLDRDGARGDCRAAADLLARASLEDGVVRLQWRSVHPARARNGGSRSLPEDDQQERPFADRRRSFAHANAERSYRGAGRYPREAAQTCFRATPRLTAASATHLSCAESATPIDDRFDPSQRARTGDWIGDPPIARGAGRPRAGCHKRTHPPRARPDECPDTCPEFGLGGGGILADCSRRGHARRAK